MTFTIPNAIAATYAPQAQVDAGDIAILAAGSLGTGVVSGCAVTAQVTPNMTVAVAAGSIQVGRAGANVTGSNQTIGAADPTLNRFDLIVASSAGALSVVPGTAAAIAQYPSIPANSVVLASVYIPAAATTIATNQIIDKRVLVTTPIMLNVRDFGAKGDGTTDDTSAIINAIADLPASGGIIFLPAGIYKLTGPLSISISGVTLMGAGWGGPTGGGGTDGTVLKLANGVNDYAIKFTPGASVRLDGITIRDLKIDCNGANQTGGGGISAFGAAYGLFEHLWIETPYQDGINFTSDNLGGFGHHHVVRACWFHGGTSSPLAGGGRGVACITADETRIVDCVFEKCGTAGGTFNGAAFYDSAGLQTLSDCVFVADPAVNGVEQAKFAASNGSQIIGCTFDGGTGTQLDLSVSGSLSACAVTACQFFQPVNTAACLVLGGKGHAITGNIFRSSPTANASKCAIDASGASGINFAANNTIITDGAWNNGLYLGFANLSIIKAAAWLNVRDFGAVGDGTADDTSAIKAAIAALPANGGTVYFPAGTYKISSTLTITAFQRLLGAGVNATQLTSTAATFPLIHAGNRQVDGIMRNDMCIEKMTVSHAGGASTNPVIWIDGGGQGTHITDVAANQGQYGFLLTDLDRCEFWNIRASNQRSAGIRCETGLENTWGTVSFHNCSVAVSDTNGIGWQWATNADQASPNAFDRVTIYSSLFFMSTGVTGGVGLQIDNPGATAFGVYGSLFEQNITHVKLNKFTQISFHDCTFLDSNNACVDILQCNTDNHTVSFYDCRFQQATNAFHSVSGFPNLSFYGRSTNQGNITNLFSGSFGQRAGSDTVFAGAAALDLGTYNQPLSHVFTSQIDLQESTVTALSNGSTISTSQKGILLCTETASVTGIILATGSDQGSSVLLRNQSGFSITFAASGTSHVAGGTAVVIPPYGTRVFSWSSVNNLWYGGNPAASFVNVKDYGATGDGATDDTTPIANAIAALPTSGGTVYFPPGTYISSPIALPNHVGLLGYGIKETILQLKAGSNATFITNHVSSNGTSDPNAEFCSIRNLMLDCNKANQTGTSHGVLFTTNPLTSGASGDDYFDTHHLLENVVIWKPLTDGFHATGRGEHRLKNVWVYLAGNDAFLPTFDSFLDNCTADHAGRHGFNLQQTSIILATCKAFYSGQVTNPGHGFYINGSPSGIALSSCYAQDNVYAGFALDTVSGVTLAACVADSNSTGGAGAWPGVDLWATTSSHVDVVCFDRKADGTNTWQTHAVRLRSTSVGNTLLIKHFAAGGATISTPIMSGSTLTQNEVVIGNLNAFLADTFAATYVPDPYVGAGIIELTLTANITINVPTQICAPGAKLTLILIQDATGGRTMTFGAGFKTNWTPSTTASKANVITFVYDGTNWYQTTAATGL